MQIVDVVRHGIDREYDKCPSIRRAIKDIDARFDVYFDHDKGRYFITQTAPNGYISVFDSFTYPPSEFFENMRRALYINRNGDDPIKDVIRKQQHYEQRQDEKLEEDIDYITKSAGQRAYQALRDA